MGDKATTSNTTSASPAPGAPAASTTEPGKSSEEYLGFVKRQNVILKITYDGLSLSELENIDCDGAPVMDAFSSTGVVSVLAGMQLVKTMKLPLIGFFESDSIPMCSTMHNEQLSNPARIYGNKTIVIFVCEFQLDDSLVPSMVDAIYDFARRHKSPMIYTIEGMPTGDKFKLESGEEVALATEEEGEEEGGVKTYIDDTKLAELHMIEKKEKKEKEKEKETPGDAKGGKKKDEKKDEKKDDKKDSKKKLDTKKDDKKEKKKKKEKIVERNEDGEEKTEDQIKEELAKKLYGDKLHYATTNQAQAVKLRSLGLIPIIDGIIVGVTGGILAKAPFSTQDVTALLAPTSTVFPSPQSAMAILKLLGQLLTGITICMSDLEKLNDELDKVTKSVLKALPAGAKNAPPSHLYT